MSVFCSIGGVVMDFGLFVMSAAIVCFITLPLVVHMLKNGSLEAKSDRIKREALEAGRVTDAKCIWYRDHRYATEDNGKIYNGGSVGVYEYVIDGVRYSKKLSSKLSSPPGSLKVYWPAGSPKKAVLESELVNGAKMNLIYVLPVILLFVVYAILVNTLGGGM